MKIYTGEIKNLFVKSFAISETGANVVTTDSVVVRKDAPFYRNFVGKLISFEYNTFLPTESEAEAYVSQVKSTHPAATISRASCLYACYDDMHAQEISKEEFKQLKKTYRDIRKTKRNR